MGTGLGTFLQWDGLCEYSVGSVWEWLRMSMIYETHANLCYGT